MSERGSERYTDADRDFPELKAMDEVATSVGRK
jgi:hypothetical protein